MGIESSCDETAVALVERGENNRMIGEQIKTQIPLHHKYGGVVPEIASRSHFETIDLLYQDLLAESGVKVESIDLVSATQGPGLIGSLLIGFMFAKTLSFLLNRPLVPVDHIDAHLDAVWIEAEPIDFPALGLVVSGGHTSLYLLQSRFERKVLARTRDDAIGEVMDKVAKHFGLGYPGGPLLDRLSAKGQPGKYTFSTPKMSDGSMDFSFSGYKTAAIRCAQKHGLHAEHIEFNHFVASFTHALVDYLILMVDRFAVIHRPKTILFSGGVSRNTVLRAKAMDFFSQKKLSVRFPEPQYCTDNAAMIAWRAYDLFREYPERFDRHLSLAPYSRSLKSTGRRHR